jgi:repressor LexA
MIDVGIFEDDVLIVKSTTQANLGEIVVARVHQDATVKRLMKDKRGFYLKAENKKFRPIYAEDQTFDIAGVVIALVRQF